MRDREGPCTIVASRLDLEGGLNRFVIRSLVCWTCYIAVRMYMIHGT